VTALGQGSPDALDRPNADPRGQAERLSQVLRAIREARRLRVVDVAEAMGMAPRSYEHFEAGRGRLDFVRLERFAEATESDPWAIVLEVMLKRPGLALAAMDNKLAVIGLLALDDFHEDLGEDIALIEPRVLVSGFRQLFQGFADHVRKRDLTVERWLDDRTRKVGLPFSLLRRSRRSER